MISLDEFHKLAEEYNVIPLERTLLADLLTPVTAYLAVRGGHSASFLLESAEPNEKIGRFSFVGIGPSVLLRSKGKEVTILDHGTTSVSERGMFDVLQRYVSRYRYAPCGSRQGFNGGFVGYIGYDCVNEIEQIALPATGASDLDDAMLGLFETTIRFDHRNHLVTITANVVIDSAVPLQKQYESGKKRLDALELILKRVAVATTAFACDAVHSTGAADASRFCDAVRRAKEYIVEGDIFQVVLSRRLTMRFAGDPFPVYRALRIINPSPYLFYLDFGETKLIGSSPEVLVRSLNGTVELLPIAGTRMRGKDASEDLALEQELLKDEKELAEHLMLVDLGRNDVGRICEYGSVHVPVFKRVDRFSHVMHLVSEVQGKLVPGKSPVDVLKACFPAGTVSGAPKVRAMEIISELEGSRRGVYAGAVGYIGFDGAMDTCIAIRTIVAHGHELTVQAGAGIVAGSVPEGEYKETENKAKALLEAIRLADRGLQL